MKNEIIRDPKTGLVTKIRSIEYPKSKTQQQFKEQVDINNIMKKYMRTRDPSIFNRTGGIYADVSNLGDYQENLNKVLAAQAAFQELPSGIRSKFQNDPSQIISWLQDEKNRDEAIKLGLIEPVTTHAKTNQNENANQPVPNDSPKT